MQYIKNKWYKLNSNWYAKFNKIIGVNSVTLRTDWAYTESITLNKTYGNHPNASIDISNLKSIELADMNEVSKYLPDGHPDKINSIPEYVECIKESEGNYGIIGKIYKVKCEYTDGTGVPCDWILEGSTSNSVSKKRFKPSTKEAYDLQEGKTSFTYQVGDWIIPINTNNWGGITQIIQWIDGNTFKTTYIINGVNQDIQLNFIKRLATQDEIGKYLIEEAKKRYPDNTLFIPAHLPTTKQTCLRRPEYHFYYEKDIIYLKNEQGLVVNNNVGQSYVVYHNGKWAEIISKPEVKEEVKWQVGGWIKYPIQHGDYPPNSYFQIDKISGSSVVCKEKFPSSSGSDQVHLYLNKCEWIGVEKPLEECITQSYDQSLVNEMVEFGSKDYDVGKYPIMDYGTKGESNTLNFEVFWKYMKTIKPKSKIKPIQVLKIQEAVVFKNNKKSKLIII